MNDAAPPLLLRKARSLRLRLRALLGRGTLPNAIIIGAMKSGTTSLFEYLTQHPDVCGSRTKELHFFDNQFAKGTRWYRANFAPRGETVVLESSPYYFFHPLAAERAAALVPQAKLILLLRNPVDRAYSHFNQNKEEGLEPLSFEEALEAETGRLAGAEEALVSGRAATSHVHQTFSYAAKGVYAPQLRRWLEHFPREQMLILKAEDLFRNPQDTIDRVTDFLGIARFAVADLSGGNRRRYPLMNPQTRQRLEAPFEAANAETQALTGISWAKRPADAPLSPAEIDLQSPHLLRAPWPGYEAVRAHGEVVWLPRQGFWLVVGYHAVREALSRPDLFSSAPYRSIDPVLAGADPPAHARARHLVEQLFTPEAIAMASGAARAEAEKRIAPEFDAVRGFARPVAVSAVATLLGLPAAAIPLTADPFGSAFVHAAEAAEAHQRWRGHGLSAAEALSLFRMTWLAGTVALERTLAWSAHALAADPALQERLRADATLIPAFADEIIRLHPPTHMISRVATEDTRLGGAEIPAGAPVRLCLSAANRDPARFERPDAVDLARFPGTHLGLGAGPHACAGAALAKAVLPEVIGVLANRRFDPVAPAAIRLEQSVDALAPAALPLRVTVL